MFGIKKGDPVSTVERELENLMQREARLRGRLTAAETELTRATAARRNLLLDGADDSAAIERAGDDVRIGEDCCRALGDALAEIERQRRAAESTLADAREQVERQRAAEELETLVATTAATLEAYRVGAVDLIDALKSINIGNGLAAGLSQHTEWFGGQVVAMQIELQAKRQSIIAGAAAVTKVEQPGEPPTVAPTTEREVVHALEFIRWREAGEIKTAAQYSEVALPVALVPVALAHHLVDRYSSPSTGQIMGAYGKYHGGVREIYRRGAVSR